MGEILIFIEKSVVVNDDTIKTEELGHIFIDIAKTSTKASEKLTIIINENPNGALDI